MSVLSLITSNTICPIVPFSLEYGIVDIDKPSSNMRYLEDFTVDSSLLVSAMIVQLYGPDCIPIGFNNGSFTDTLKSTSPDDLKEL